MKPAKPYKRSKPGGSNSNVDASLPSVRINARLDDESAMKVDYLIQTTGANLTSVMKEAITHYYAEVRRTHSHPAEILTQEGFVGCADGASDLSANYKEHLTSDLAAKYDLG